MRPLANYIDHTLLAADTLKHKSRNCAEAAEHGFFSVCINTYIPLARTCLKGSDVKYVVLSTSHLVLV